MLRGLGLFLAKLLRDLASQHVVTYVPVKTQYHIKLLIIKLKLVKWSLIVCVCVCVCVCACVCVCVCV